MNEAKTTQMTHQQMAKDNAILPIDDIKYYKPIDAIKYYQQMA